MIDFLNEGGIFMYIILAVSVVAVAIIIEKVYMLHFYYKPRQTFFNDIINYVKKEIFHQPSFSAAAPITPLQRSLPFFSTTITTARRRWNPRSARRCRS